MTRFGPAAWFTCTTLLASSAGELAATREAPQVLLLYDERTELPGLAVLDGAIERTIRSESSRPIDIYRVGMDLSRFDSAAYRGSLRDFLDEKFEGKRIDAVVAVMGPALDFLVEHHDAVFPGAAIVFCGLDRRDLEARRLPPGTTGVLFARQFAPTLELALRLHPDVRRVIFVAGSSAFDTRLVEQARAELSAFEPRVELAWMTGLPLAELLAELGRLPPHSLVLFSTIFRDGAGEAFVPHEVVGRVSEAANAPVYGFLDQYIGRGIVGGRLYGFSDDGEQAARLVLRILAGEDPDALPPVVSGTTTTQFDWAQMERWGIRARSLPPEAVVRFRPPTLWRDHRREVLWIAAVVLVQMLLIAGLLLQRARRRRAEAALRESDLEGQRSRVELAHVARAATMGELTASLAHELKQPLTAILANADAGRMLLDSSRPDLGEIREILEDIRTDDRRASDVLGRMRRLMEKHDLEREPVALNETVEETLGLLALEAAERRAAIHFEPSQETAWVSGDRIHLQQVVMNLVLNGLEAMAGVPEDRRRLAVRTGPGAAGMVEISVSDSGHGIADEQLPHLFEPFWTTKAKGLGMGLSISRSIVEAHDGKIWAENAAGGEGATFHVVLPALEPGRA